MTRRSALLVALIAIAAFGVVLIARIDRADHITACQNLMNSPGLSAAWGQRYSELGCAEFLKTGEIK